MDLTILIPVKNEEKNIESILKEITDTIRLDYEILFVNDFSSDSTLDTIHYFKNKNNKIKLVKNDKWVRTVNQKWIKHSNGKYLSILMCDGSDDLDDLNRYFFTIKDENLDAVFGSRFLHKSKIYDYPKFKLILNRIFNYFVSLVYLNKYNDYTNAFKIYKKDTLLKIEPIVSESFNVFLELPLKIINRKLNYKIISINWYGRKDGVSKFKFKELRSKYLFTLIYCLAEKILLLK